MTMSSRTVLSAPISSYLQQIYDEAVTCFEACELDKINIADTWVHSLQRKGRHYSFDEMLNMRRPGSYVTLHINIFDYFCDQTRIDPADTYVETILAAGESNVGRPIMDVPINERHYSSVYLKHVDIAAKIIAHLESKKIDRPTILEIGGGQGLLLAALRQWYGDRLTVIAADIPETLFYQSFYLRACFPDVAYTFKPTDRPVPLKEGGFNFVNAYSLESQDYVIDAAINNNSMQEMTAEVANSYIKYIERTIGSHGSFFFRNSFGHALGSVTEPSEYELDSHWKVAAADYGDYFFDVSATPFASFVFDRDLVNVHNRESRRALLRLIWNATASSRISTGPGSVTERLVKLDTTASVETLCAGACSILVAAGLDAASEWMTSLRGSQYLPTDAYSRSAPILDTATNHRWDCPSVISEIQKATISAMQDAAHGGMPTNAPLNLLHRSSAAKSALALSDYWTGYAASIAVALGDKNLVKEIIDRRAKSENSYWRIRFAWLLSRADDIDGTRLLLDGTPVDSIDVFWWPMIAVLRNHLGDREQAEFLLDQAARRADKEKSDELRHVLFRVNARIGRIQTLPSLYESLSDQYDARRLQNQLTLLRGLLRVRPDERTLVRAFLSKIDPKPSAPFAEIEFRLGNVEHAHITLSKLIEASWDSYYALGGLIGTLFAIGDDVAAERCMQRSVMLRPDATRHFEFLGQACFAAGRYAAAVRWFDQLLSRKPYDIVHRGFREYANLPESVRAARQFGGAEDQQMIYQNYQSFYYPDGPQIR
jgi:tetratricopeptide (TPR) repeat protein